MAKTLFFYDLETSGFNPRDARIMQFAGQRTDMSLKPIGEPYNVLIKMTDEVVPEPDAILVTGITPQQTIRDGITEAEFLRLFHDEIAVPGTIFLGYNSVRFDDEFIRYLHYRNFYDPYEWHWMDGKSRWDLLDVVRMTRALRPDGIEWPVDSTGKPANKLELLTAVNGIEHEDAHDALSDVRAVIAIASLIRDKQPKLFDYLLNMREKDAVKNLVMGGKPFVYTSGKYSTEYEKTTVVASLAEHPNRAGGAMLVFDLRHDPRPFAKMTSDELIAAWTRRYNEPGLRLPVKTLQYNRCPAIAPLSVLDEASRSRLSLEPELYEKNLRYLQEVQQDLVLRLTDALSKMQERQQARLLEDVSDVDARLYEDFIDKSDKQKMSVVRASGQDELGTLHLDFDDQRLELLLPLYKARNFPASLDSDEKVEWEKFRERRLLSGGTNSRLARFFSRLGELAEEPSMTEQKRYVLEELQLYGQSIMPSED